MIIDLPFDKERLYQFRDLVKDTGTPKENDDYAIGNIGSLYNPGGSVPMAVSLMPEIEKYTGCALKHTNNFSWYWGRGAQLVKHTDRDTLDWTVSIPLDEQSALWPLRVPDHTYQCRFLQGILVNGINIPHWRDTLMEDRSAWLMFHYEETQCPDRPVVVQGLLTNADIQNIERQRNEEMEQATVTGEGYTRESQVSWLHRNDKWQWLYNKIEPVMYSHFPNMEYHNHGEALQYTYYGVGGFFNLHADCGDMTPWRSISATIMIKNAIRGGQFRIEDFGTYNLGAGDAVIFPSTLNHEVSSIIEGERVSLVLWL